MKRAPLLVCLLTSIAPAQYTSTVVAGGGPPNGAAATAIAISPAPGVAVDSAGNLYIAAQTQHRVYKVSPTGVVTTFAGTGVAGFSGDGGQAASAQLNSPAAVAVDSSGVFITDGSNYRIRKVSSGVITTVAGNGSPTAYGDGAPAISAGIGVPGGIAVDSGGSLYIADTVNCRVRKVSGSLISTLAGTGSCGYSGDGASAASAQLSAPGAVAVSGSNVYIADSGNYRIRKVTGGVITTFAGTGTMGYAGDGGPAAAAQLSYVQSLATDSLGNLYIGHYSAVRKVTGTTITTVAGGGSGGDGGPATAAKLDSPTGLALDSSRNLFIGDTARVRKVSVTNGVITTVAGNGFGSFSGDGGPAANAQISPDALAVDGAGKLYISNPADYRVRMVAGGVIGTIAGGGAYGTRGDGGPATGASVNPSAVAADSTGNLYIVDGTTIRKVAGGVITTIAGSDTAAGYSGDGGFARNARIGFAQAIAVDNGGNIYFVDQSRIRKIAAGWISTIAGAGPADGAAASAVSVGSPNVALDSAGYLYVASSTLHRVFRVAPTGALTTVAGNGTPGFSGDGGSAASAQLAAPSGVAVDSAGNVYIADSGNLRVRKVASGVISTFAGGGSGCAQQINSFGDNCPPPSAQLGWVNSLAVDSAGNVYIGDGNYRVRKVSGGIISTIAGNGVNGYSGDNGPATSAQIGPAQGLAVDASLNVYIADAGNSRVRKVAGGTITTVAGTGLPAYSGDGGAATGAQLNFPSGVGVDGSGNLYIADTGNSRVRVVSSSGIINTVAGSGTYGYFGDGGAATGAQLKSPSGIAVNSAGTNVYIADRGDFRVRKVTGGLIATVAGNGLQAFSGDGGPAPTAQFDSPAGLAIDGAGNIYVADTNNGRIRVIGMDGIVRTFAGGGAEGAASGGLALNAMMRPQRIAVDGGGKLYVIDETFRLLRRVSGGVVTTVGPLADAGSNAGVAVDAAGGVYVSEPSTGRVLLYRAGCSYSLAPVSGVVPPAGGTGTLAVNASAGCPWTAVSNASWITVTAVSVQSLSYSAAANSTAAQRVGTITIGGQTFTVTQSAGNSAVPSIVAVTPFQGSGAGATFTVQYRDGAGWTALQKLEFLVNPRFETPAGGCYVQYTPVDNLFRLYADDGVAVAGALPPGFAGTISNSQCTLSVGSSTAVGSGTDVTLSISLSFKASFTGQKHLWVRATDFSIPSRTSDWMVFGVWVPGQGTARAIEWYRIFDPFSNTYLYSADAYEYQELGRRGFVLQGIAGKVLDGPMSIIAPSGASVPDMVWWRVYVKSNGSHFWTSDRNEYLTLIRSGAYVGEGAAAFVMPYIDAQGAVAPQVTNTIPFYRAAYTAGGDLHFWTADADEYSGRNGKHLPAGYKGEGIAAYVFPVSGADFGQQPPPKLQSAVDDASPLVVSAVSSASLSRGPIAAGESLTILGDRLGGTVRINGVPAQVQSASEHEMRIIVPADLAGATDAAIVVETEGRRSHPLHTRVVRANPAIFASNQYGRGQAQALLEDGTRNGAENPAARGSLVTLYATGAGLLDLPVSAHIDGYAAEVVAVQESAARAGVVEVKVRIPDVVEPGPDRPITIEVGNFSSQAGVGLAIR